MSNTNLQHARIIGTRWGRDRGGIWRRRAYSGNSWTNNIYLLGDIGRMGRERASRRISYILFVHELVEGKEKIRGEEPNVCGHPAPIRDPCFQVQMHYRYCSSHNWPSSENISYIKCTGGKNKHTHWVWSSWDWDGNLVESMVMEGREYTIHHACPIAQNMGCGKTIRLWSLRLWDGRRICVVCAYIGKEIKIRNNFHQGIIEVFDARKEKKRSKYGYVWKICIIAPRRVRFCYLGSLTVGCGMGVDCQRDHGRLFFFFKESLITFIMAVS